MTGNGTERTLHVTPGTRGITKLTVTVEDPGGGLRSTQITYGASAYQGNTSDRYYSEAADTGATLDVGGGYMIAAGDEGNGVRLYKERESGPPAKSGRLTHLPFGAQPANIHGIARAGNIVYFVGGMANNQKGSADHLTRCTPPRSPGPVPTPNSRTWASYTGLRQDLDRMGRRER